MIRYWTRSDLCGTSIAASQRSERKWIGIDITHLAITLIKHRLTTAYGASVIKTYNIIGEPTSLPDAQTLAREDPYQFQWWALGLVGARPTEEKKGADQGIDGRLYFHDTNVPEEIKQVVFSVKAGHTTSSHIRDLGHVVDREKAVIGVLITMNEPTQLMKTEAAGKGFYKPPMQSSKHPILQILTIKELLDGARIDYSPIRLNVTLKNAPKVTAKDPLTDISKPVIEVTEMSTIEDFNTGVKESGEKSKKKK